MTKVTKPIKEFWETDKKPDFMTLIKKENDTGIVRVKRLETKRKNKGSGLKKLGVE